MSKVAIQGNASGTGTFTIAAPNSNTDRTLTLPDEAGTVLTSVSSIPASSITGLTQGITEMDQWRTTAANTVASGNTVTANWARWNNNATYIGSGMTESSGVFTFPSTGVWIIFAVASVYASAQAQFAGFKIAVSTDGGSNYIDRTETIGNSAGTNYFVNVGTHLTIDVTDTSNFKVKMNSLSSVSIQFDGSASQFRTGFTFIKLGDT